MAWLALRETDTAGTGKCDRLANSPLHGILEFHMRPNGRDKTITGQSTE